MSTLRFVVAYGLCLSGGDCLPLSSLVKLQTRHIGRRLTMALRHWWRQRDARPIRERLTADRKTGMMFLERQALLTAILCAVWFGWPYYRYYISTSPAFSAMVEVLPANSWGLIFYALSALMLVAYLTGHNTLRRAMVGINLFLWGGITLLMFKEAPTGFGVVLGPITLANELYRSSRLKERRKTPRSDGID